MTAFVRLGGAPLIVFLTTFLSAVSWASSGGTDGLSESDAATYRGLIEEMKAAPRGPFKQLRWFCADGSVLPPKAYACTELGGGHRELGIDAARRRGRAAHFDRTPSNALEPKPG